jgi:hypothetical protein
VNEWDQAVSVAALGIYLTEDAVLNAPKQCANFLRVDFDILQRRTPEEQFGQKLPWHEGRTPTDQKTGPSDSRRSDCPLRGANAHPVCDKLQELQATGAVSDKTYSEKSIDCVVRPSLQSNFFRPHAQGTAPLRCPQYPVITAGHEACL